MTNRIETIDALPGSGKTYAIINWMLDNPHERYMYVSPMLSEVEQRVPEEAEDLDFKFPETGLIYKTKADSLLALLQDGHNVAFTHSLYSRLKKEHLRVIEAMGYVLVLDEEVGLIEPLSVDNTDTLKSSHYSSSEIQCLYDDGKLTVDVEDYGCLKWNWKDYPEVGKYSKLMGLCSMSMVYCTVSKDDNGKDKLGSLVIQLPLELVTAAKRCIAISYLFKGSVLDVFLQMKGLVVEPFDMTKENVTLRYSNQDIKQELQELITFIDTPTTKKLSRKSLSFTWYQNEFTKDNAKLVSDAIISVCRKTKSNAISVMWTVPQFRAEALSSKSRTVKPPRFSAKDCYVYCACRATNQYAHKKTLIHGVYRHPNVTLQSYLTNRGYPIDVDTFALAELIQWVFRSAIRNKEPISLCILSVRMRRLFSEWLTS